MANAAEARSAGSPTDALAKRLRFRLLRRPVRVRLNRSLFPAELLTIQVKRGILRGVNLMFESTDGNMKAGSGGDFEPGDVAAGEWIDILVTDSPASRLELPRQRLTHFHAVPENGAFIFTLSWTGSGRSVGPGKVTVVWTHRDRASGRRPLIAYDAEAQVLLEYTNEPQQLITSQLLSIRRRVRLLGQFDIWRRYRREKKTKMTNPTYARATISSLSVLGFRGFREEATLALATPNNKDGSGLTIVVGANNAGKSTIWESFDAIARKSKTDVSFSEGRRNRGSADGIRLTLRQGDGSAFTVRSINRDTSETVKEWSGPAEASPPTLEIVVVPSRRQFQASFSKNANPQRDWMSSTPEFSRSAARDQFSNRLFDLHQDSTKKAVFDQLMTEVLGHPLSWTIDLTEGQNYSQYYLKVTTAEGVSHSSEGLGDGIISLLFILNALYDAEPSTLLVLDEPELSLHPQLVRRLGRVIARFAKTCQIVVFTHSPYLVSWADIEAGAEIARVYKLDGDSRIAQAKRSTLDEISKARGGWKNPHVLGVDANAALFLDDKVIVVEGQEDAILLPKAFELAGVDNTAAIFGWGSGGESNVGRILALLKDLEFRRVAAVLDNNVPETVAALRDAFPEYRIVEIPAADIRDKPADGRPAVKGLLNERGKTLKPELMDAAKQVLSDVTTFLESTSGDSV